MVDQKHKIFRDKEIEDWIEQDCIKNIEKTKEILSMRILFTGDSITDAGRDKRNYHDLGHGYVSIVASRLQEEMPNVDFEFINTGISANRTGQLFDRIHYDAVAFQPDVVVLLIGINDIGRRYRPGEFHIETSDEQIEVNYRSILTQIKTHTNAKIIMMSPYILDGDISKTFSLDTPNGDNMRRDLESLTPVIEGLAKKYANDYIPLGDLFAEALKTQPEPMYYTKDGIHPSVNGVAFIAKACGDHLMKLLENQA